MSNDDENFLGKLASMNFGSSVLENFKPALPEFRAPAFPVIKNHLMADTLYEQLVESINDFEKDLAADEEVGARLAQFGQSVTVSIEDLSYHTPYLMKLHGTTPDGHRCTLLQHMTQTNILLVAMKVPKGREPRRIGYKLTHPADEKPGDEK